MPTLWILAQPSADLVDSLPARADDTVHPVGTTVGPADVMLARGAGSWRTVAVVAGSLVALRTALPIAAQAGAISELRLYVDGSRPVSAIHPPIGAVGKSYARTVTVEVLGEPVNHVRLVVNLKRPAPAGNVLAACLGSIPGVFGPPTAGLRIGISPGASLSWVAGDVATVLMDGDRPSPAPLDVVVVGSTTRTNGRASGNVVAIGGGIDGPRWTDLAVAPHRQLESTVNRMYAETVLPPVDADVLTPAGLWVNATDSGPATLRRLRSRGGDLVVQHDDGRILARIPAATGLWESHVDKLRGLRAIRVSPDTFAGPLEEATFLAQASCAALPVLGGRIEGLTRALLGEALVLTMERGADIDRDDDIAFESWLVRMHRAAFRQVRLRAEWRRQAERLGLPAPETPSVSVVIATRRPERLRTVLRQVARQSWTELQVVLGLHGCYLDDPRVKSALQGFDRPYVVREIDQSHCLGDVLQELTRVASGHFIAKMDDDDWYGPDHVSDLVHAAEFSGAVITGCGAEFVYLSERDTTIRRQSRSGHNFTSTLAGGTLLIRTADLKAVGGWRPLPRAVDTALINSVTAAGGVSYRSHGLGYVLYRGPNGHTWDEQPDYFLSKAKAQWPGLMAPAEVDRAEVPEGWCLGG